MSCALIAQAALGLSKAHESGVVHRDIKPANLFLHDGGDQGEVVLKILDFGIAKVLMDVMQRSEEGGLTRTGSMLGSPHYMSPEQAQGLRSIDQRSDIWSLGVVLYKMLAGQTPHAHLQTLGQVILAICSQPARSVQELAPWVPPDVARIVHRALQPDPGQRFQSAYEMYTALQAVTQGAPTPRRLDIQPLSPAQRTHVAPTAGTGLRSDVPTNGTQHGMTQSPLAPPKTSGVVFGLIAVGVLGLVGVAGIGAAVMAKKARPATSTASRPSTVASTLTPVDPTTGIAVASATPAAAPVERTVRLVVSPANAVVEVEGTKREIVEGTVELKGPLGAVVTVHASANGNETTQSIAITEGGAIPPTLTVLPQKPAAVAVTAGTTPTAGTRPVVKPASGKPAPSSTTLNAQRTFE